ncbi:uncharacterized protein LOC132035439 [Lycium ferocissimum]|uniref:uncharacterized protein LOC132035439 n=1 Tax=Lycium ferocissimum TaxID=112874 RepID=UPI0028152441|nr:uncharacterized protein LOC132035439 [Lycium ferocissimum]
MNNLNCHYHSNKRVWMTSVIFDEYIRWFDHKTHGRRILLVVDNCPAHPRNMEGLQNVQLLFLPPNMTSKIQPCDAGIIRAFKMHYRNRFYHVQQETIANYFRHCKICSGDEALGNLNEPTCENDIHELEVMINDLGYLNKMDVNSLLDYPGENDTCSEVQSLEEIVDTIGENNVDDEVEDDTIPLEPVKRKETRV